MNYLGPAFVKLGAIFALISASVIIKLRQQKAKQAKLILDFLIGYSWFVVRVS